MTPPRSSVRSLPLAVLALGAAGCAAHTRPPSADVVQQAFRAASYSARVRVRLAGPTLRARTAALVAFQRPDALRVEIPGPTGARFVAVTSSGRLWAVFPGERAVYSGEASPEDLEALLGVALGPAEVMDLLVGAPPPRVRAYEAHWGPRLPRRIVATLPDGARLEVFVDDAETDPALGASAFAEPPHEGYRAVDAEEARRLWSAR